MVDALASGASVRKDVGVQVPPRAQQRAPPDLIRRGFFGSREQGQRFRSLTGGVMYVVRLGVSPRRTELSNQVIAEAVGSTTGT